MLEEPGTPLRKIRVDMKIRNGFVSNSSSSSFVVRRGELLANPTGAGVVRYTTPKQDRLLQKYGFRKMVGNSPECVPCNRKEWKAEEKRVKQCCSSKFPYNYGYEILCNQDGVMVFLIENKIPFVAECHYGQYTWFYTPELDKIIVATNVGKIMDMYGDLETWDTTNDVEVMKASEWLAEEQKFWKNVGKQKE